MIRKKIIVVLDSNTQFILLVRKSLKESGVYKVLSWDEWVSRKPAPPSDLFIVGDLHLLSSIVGDACERRTILVESRAALKMDKERYSGKNLLGVEPKPLDQHQVRRVVERYI